MKFKLEKDWFCLICAIKQLRHAGWNWVWMGGFNGFGHYQYPHVLGHHRKCTFKVYKIQRKYKWYDTYPYWRPE